MRKTNVANAVVTARRSVGCFLLAGLALWLGESHETAAAVDTRRSTLSVHEPDILTRQTNTLRAAVSSTPVVALVARLAIPRLRLEWFVLSASAVSAYSSHALHQGPRHVAGTAFPGEIGNCVIAGRCDTQFNALKNVEEGDYVVMEASAGPFAYRVMQTAVVSPDDKAIVHISEKSLLTLVTCYPFNHATPPQAFVVRAELTQRGTVASLR